MRKKFIKEMALVLSAATVMSSVTACSNSGGDNTEATTQAVTTAIDDGQGNGGQDNTSEDSGKKLAGDYSKEEPIEKIVLQAEDGEFKGNVKVVVRRTKRLNDLGTAIIGGHVTNKYENCDSNYDKSSSIHNSLIH